jgi:hypothetical protein
MKGQTNFPAPNTPLADERGHVTLMWRNFFQALYDRSGGSTASANAAINGSETQSFNVGNATAPTHAMSLSQYRAQPGTAPASIAVGASPWTFTAPGNGMLILANGKITGIELQRAGVQAAVAAPVLMRQNDQAIVTYTTAPEAIWFPN